MIFEMMAATLLAPATGGPKPVARARASLNTYFSADDYPKTALRRGIQGMVGFRLQISPEGRVVKCVVTRSARDAALDAATCSILRVRARYKPARDLQGRAVMGSAEGRVAWRLPAEQGMPFAPTRVVARLHADGMGNVSCTVAVDAAPAADTDPARCGGLTGSRVQNPLRRVRVPTDVTLVFAAGPSASGIDAVQPEERGYGRSVFDLVADFEVAPDGHAASCTMVRRDVAPDSGSTVPDMCTADRNRTLYQPGTGAEPRQVRHRLALYLIGGPPELQPSQPGALRARANLAELFGPDDYPEGAMTRDAEGTVQFRLRINPEGRVAACEVTASSGDSSLDEATCAIIRDRARYEPARDPAGRPEPGLDMGRVTWRLPAGSEALPFEPVRMVTRMRRTAAGEIGCTVTLDGETPPGETRGECGYLMGSGAQDLLRAATGSAEIVMVFASGPAEAAVDAPGPDEAGYGAPLIETVASLSIAQDGRLADCRTIRRVVPDRFSAIRGVDQCALESSRDEPLFEASTDATPRRARLRTVYFISGALPGAPPAPRR
jgi:TonB family protein